VALQVGPFLAGRITQMPVLQCKQRETKSVCPILMPVTLFTSCGGYIWSLLVSAVCVRSIIKGNSMVNSQTCLFLRCWSATLVNLDDTGGDRMFVFGLRNDRRGYHSSSRICDYASCVCMYVYLGSWWSTVHPPSGRRADLHGSDIAARLRDRSAIRRVA
jgi:hypothetical protein